MGGTVRILPVHPEVAYFLKKVTWIYRFKATGSLGYTGCTAAEDRATLGSDLSAAVAAIRHGRHPIWVPPVSYCAGGPKAINPCLFCSYRHCRKSTLEPDEPLSPSRWQPSKR